MSYVVDDEEDGRTVDSIVTALYESLSFLPGDEPDWKRFENLFLPNAIFIPPVSATDGEVEPMNLASFIVYVKSSLKEAGFMHKGYLEVEISRRIEKFGAIANVFSTFEDRISIDEPDPVMRGINSLQLINFDDRWWISSMTWDYESDSQIIPSRYLSNN